MPVSQNVRGDMVDGWHGQRKSDMAIFSLSAHYNGGTASMIGENVLFKVKTIF
jgi:hypothetical protein